MTRPLSLNKKLTGYFKDYVRKAMAAQKLTVLDECDMVYCLGLAIDRVELDTKENAIHQLAESKNDISRNANYAKMVVALNILAQWTDEVEEADCPWAASNARAVLADIGETKK